MKRALVGTCVLLALAACGQSEKQASTDPYQACLETSRRANYASEVCEPLMPGYVEGARINLGVVREAFPDGTVTESPALAADIADSCADVNYSVDCIASVIDHHRIR